MRKIREYFSSELIFIFPLLLIWFELVLKFSCFDLSSIFFVDYVITILTAGMISSLLFTIFINLNEKIAKFLALAVVLGIFFIYATQIIYFHKFDTFVTMYTILYGSGNAKEFSYQAYLAFVESLPILIILFLPIPFFIFALFKLRIKERAGFFQTLMSLIVTICFCLVTFGVFQFAQSGIMTSKRTQDKKFILEPSIKNIGVMPTMLKDFYYHIANFEPKPRTDTTLLLNQKDYKEQILDIDFETLIQNEEDEDIRSMHQFFYKKRSTRRNNYTNMFKNKNLIVITAESFSPLALKSGKLKTLEKLSREGIVCKNFYNPLWGVSTLDGEYSILESQYPKPGTWSMLKSSKNFLPFTYAHYFNELSCNSRAYHNHKWDYYSRNLSHPNMGYDYKGLGHGLSLKEQMPASDLEMVDKTIDEYINDDMFHTYYLTMSGHMLYDFEHNAMSIKHKEEVASLDYSEENKAYFACQIELDKMIERLIYKLQEADKLDDTVIVLTGDHYPYGLSDDSLSELLGDKVSDPFEKYRGTLIIWNSAMKNNIIVEKTCAAVDILPTVLNLFGFEYDSRLLVGKDILSDSIGQVVFANYSWINDKIGKYNSINDVFTPSVFTSELANDYAAKMMENSEEISELSDKEAVVQKYIDEYYINIAGETTDKYNEDMQFSYQVLDTNYYQILTDKGVIFK